MRAARFRNAVLWVLPAAAALVLTCAAIALPRTVQASPERVDQLVRTALESDRDAKSGAILYRQHCGSCHGRDALGNAERVIPSLAGQRQAYLIKQLADFAELERDSPDMHAVVSKTAIAQPQAWADLAAYLNEQPVARFPETGDGSGVELGEAIFQEQCASCHEEDARGDDDGFVPSLRNQHYSYLLLQTRGLASWHRANVDADLVRYLDSLEVDELTGVADYLSRMKGPVRDRAKLRDDGTVGD